MIAEFGRRKAENRTTGLNAEFGRRNAEFGKQNNTDDFNKNILSFQYILPNKNIEDHFHAVGENQETCKEYGESQD